MDYAKLSKFVRDHGDVKVFSSGKERKLRSGDLDVIDVVEKAEKFEFDGKLYSRAQLEEIIEKS